MLETCSLRRAARMLTHRAASFMLVSFVGGVLLACTQSQNKVPDGDLVAEGFDVFPSARSFGEPGRILRVDENGHTFLVTTLGVPAELGTEVLPRIVEERTKSLRAILSSLGVLDDALSLELGASIDSKFQVKIESVDGKRYFLSDKEVDDALGRALEGIRIRDGNVYYLIRETIYTDRLSYTFVDKLVLESNLKTQFEGLANVGLNLGFTSAGLVELDRTFPSPLGVWFKAERIEPTFGSEDSRGGLAESYTLIPASGAEISSLVVGSGEAVP